jgi:hypothetical protein
MAGPGNTGPANKKNYMKLRNDSTEFVLRFRAEEFTIPNGEFEVGDSALAHHILATAFKWNKKVIDLGADKPAAVRAVKKPAIIKTKTEEVVVEEEVAPKQPGRPRKNVEPVA